jgi:hypothetical protein
MQKNRNKFLGFILIFIVGSAFARVDSAFKKSDRVHAKAFNPVVQAVFDKRLSEYRQAYQRRVHNSMADAGVSYFDLEGDEVLLKRLIDRYAKIQAEAFVVHGLKTLAETRSLQQLYSPESLEAALEKIDRDDPFYVRRFVYGQELRAVKHRVHSIIESKRSHRNFKFLSWLFPVGVLSTVLVALFGKKWWDEWQKPQAFNEGSSASYKNSPQGNSGSGNDNKSNTHGTGTLFFKEGAGVWPVEEHPFLGSKDGSVFAFRRDAFRVLPERDASVVGQTSQLPGAVLQSTIITSQESEKNKLIKDLLNCAECPDPYERLLELIKAIRSGGNPNIVDNDGNNVFHFYVSNIEAIIEKGEIKVGSDSSSFKELFKLGVYFDAKNDEGVTPLALLVNKYGGRGSEVKKDAIALAMDYGADIGKLNGETQRKLNDILKKMLKYKRQIFINMLLGDIKGMVESITNLLMARSLVPKENKEVRSIDLFIENLIKEILCRGDLDALQALVKLIKNNGLENTFLKNYYSAGYNNFISSKKALSSLEALGEECGGKLYKENIQSLKIFIENVKQTLKAYNSNFDHDVLEECGVLQVE